MHSNKLKEIAKDFLLLCAPGRSREAFDKYVGAGFIHHNAYFKGDPETIMLAMEQAAKDNPGIIFQIKQIIAEENKVAVHSHYRANATDPGYSVMHIFRFAGDQIVELWDFGQQVPADCVNENGMF